MAHRPSSTSEKDIAAAISDDLLHIHTTSYGVGATTAKTYVNESLVVCFLDGLELLPNEAYLISQGQANLVLEMRGRYQEVIGPAFTAAVERATGRRVTHFFSETALEPPFAVEMFRLEPPVA